MLQAFVLTLREGLEAFLIVAISLAYLKKSGRREFVPAVHWGVAASIVVSVAAATVFQRASNQALWEGVLAMVAAVLVVSLTIHMWRIARRMKREIEGRIEASAAKGGMMGFAAIFGFTLLMITREGMETALLLNALMFQLGSMTLLAAASSGLLVAAGVAWLWSCYGHRVNLGRFFQVTGVFLLVFSVQLFIYGFHELTEANIFPYSETLHWATEPYGPDGRYGQHLSYLLVLLPIAWLLVSLDEGPRVRISELLSFKGRVGRGAFWAVYLIGFLVSLLMVGIVDLIATTSAGEIWVPIILLVWMVLGAWVTLATCAKRWHDVGSSGWMTLLLLVPLANLLVLAFIGFAKGTGAEMSNMQSGSVLGLRQRA